MEPTQQSAQIRRLKIIVAVLIATQVMTLAMIAAFFRDFRSASQPTVSATTEEPLPEELREFEEWNNLPIEEKVRRSSAIVIATFKVEGTKVKATTTEVIVRDPAAKVYYVRGEEARALSKTNQKNTDWGDGMVALLTGSPASVRESYSYRDGRIAGLGDMPLDELKRLARAP